MMNLLASRKIILFGEIIVLLSIVLLCFYTRTTQLDDYQFIIGGDAYTHAAVSKSIIENKSIPSIKPIFYPESNLTYPPLYQVTTAFLSIITNFDLNIIYRYLGPILSLISLLLIYFLLRTITKNKYAVFTTLYLFIFFPIIKEMQSVSIPDNMNYIFIPLGILISYKYVSTKKSKFLILSVLTLIIGILFHIANILLVIPIVVSYFIGKGIKKKSILYFFSFFIILTVLAFLIYPKLFNNILPSLIETLMRNFDGFGDLIANIGEINLLSIINSNIYFLYILLLIFGFIYIYKNKQNYSFFIYISSYFFIFIVTLFFLNIGQDLIIRTLPYLIVFTLPIICFGIINILAILKNKYWHVLLVIILIIISFSVSDTNWDTRMTESEYYAFQYFNEISDRDLLIVPPILTYHAQFIINEPSKVLNVGNICTYQNNTKYDINTNLTKLQKEFGNDVYLFIPFEKLNTWWVKHNFWGPKVCAGTDIDSLRSNTALKLVYKDGDTFIFKLITNN